MNDQVNEDKNIGATVEDLKTGRDLDAEVAERVMGECAHVLIEDTAATRRAFKCSKCDLRGFDFLTDYVGRSLVSAYSTDIPAAMLVVDKLYAAEWDVEIYRGVVIDDDWLVRFSHLRDDDRTDNVNHCAKTLPEAICRAALKATECLSISGHGTNGKAS